MSKEYRYTFNSDKARGDSVLGYRYDKRAHQVSLSLSHEEFECLIAALANANDTKSMWEKRDVKRAKALEARLQEISNEIGFSPTLVHVNSIVEKELQALFTTFANKKGARKR